MVLATSVPNVGAIVVSEYSAGLAWLSTNVEANRSRFRCPLEVCECDWQWFLPGADADERALARGVVDRGWDLVLGSDLVYNEIGVNGLPRCIAALANACPCILYAHTLHRFDDNDVSFFANLHWNGLVYREVSADCAGDEGPAKDGRSSSPPPFSELFPEQRQAVFRISRDPGMLGGPPDDRHSVAIYDT
ncbi:hypothetical protein T492DRAFT_984223 [Pavlovales sp. CCMP2436]|nr:hypothetical protein T492DRAFT_984223 [Pavlovales sp. CCMP2436]